MDIDKAISALRCENDLTLFDATTGETKEYWTLRGLSKEWYDAHEFCISALTELQQYRQIGTVDEFREAKERQIAEKPDYEGDGDYNGEPVYDTWICPNCEEHYEVGYDDQEYCPKCGQHIKHEDWERE